METQSTVVLLHLAPVVVSIATAVYVYGRLTEKVVAAKEAIGKLAEVDEKQWNMLNVHEGRISSIEGQLK